MYEESVGLYILSFVCFFALIFGGFFIEIIVNEIFAAIVMKKFYNKR